MPTQQRKTRRRFENACDVRFLTFSCCQHLPLFDNDAIKDKFVEVIEATRRTTRFRLYAWVIMPNHVHFLIQPSLPDYPVAAILKELKGQLANIVLRRWRELDAPILNRIKDRRGRPHFWQRGGGYDRNIYTDEELLEKLHYIHNNPVGRGLVEDPIDWKWSSARWYEGEQGAGMPVMDPLPL
ncbi:MAG: REP-associated tyrosine transposase [Planctomycetota bacterium]|jgi:putative transposase